MGLTLIQCLTPSPVVLLLSSIHLQLILADGEMVPFCEELYPTGNVEDWLLEVERVMRSSLKAIIRDSLVDYTRVRGSVCVCVCVCVCARVCVLGGGCVQSREYVGVECVCC